jgi:branched-chain amino acid transport system ATP-binding protein
VRPPRPAGTRAGALAWTRAGTLAEPWGRERTLASLGLLAVAGVIAVAVAGRLSPNALNIGATLFVYIALAQAWNILAGLSGQVSLGVGAFVGAGAYAMGLVMVHAGAGLVPGLAVAAGAGGLLGLLLAVPLLRLRGDYFAVGTLAAALALQAWLLNWSFAGGSTGLSLPVGAIPSLSGLYRLGVVVGVLGIGAAVVVRGSRFGLRLLAIREHEEAAATLGVNTWRMRVGALVLSSVLMGLAGGAFAVLQLSFEPNGMVGLNWTIWALMMVVIGGFGTITGPIAGAVFVYYVVATELASYPTLGLFIEGALLIVIVRFAPRGIVPLAVDGIRSGVTRWRGAKDRSDTSLDAAAVADPRPRPPARAVRPLVVADLVKHFGSVIATDRVSLRVEPGEAVGLIGPNGSGKSTLLKMIAGIERPDSGSVTLGETTLRGREPHVVSRLGIAVAMQVPRPFAGLTVHENVRIAAGHHAGHHAGHRGGERQTAGEVLGMCGLTHRAHAKAGSLGLLDLKRLEFARALATDPAVILLDEVAAGLVGEELAEVIALIKRVNATGRSVIVVEHVQQVISEVVDRVLVLSSGKLIAEGTPAEIEANAEVEQVYYGARGARRPAATPAAALATASSPPPAVLQVDNVSAGYGSLVALRDVSLVIRPADVVSVLGANGAGKSTLAATVSGQLRPVQGSIAFEGQVITRAPAYERARLGICLCPEGRGIFTGLTVEENLLLGVPLRRRRDDFAKDLDGVYEILPVLRSRARQQAGSLSGGEQQMLAIGRALLMSPKLLICDELSLGLAPKIAEEVYETLLRVNATGVAILLIEQNVHRALEISTAAYVLNRGEVTFAGAPSELANERVLARAYFASGARAD